MKTEKRVINVPLGDFKAMKAYCDSKALNLPKWIVQIAKETMWQDMKQKMTDMGTGGKP